jgi:diketogulonate reductase-like aldo/keto reductase
MWPYNLTNGINIPCIGFGTWKVPDGDQATDIIKDAINAGYRHIDTAAAYGNELGVGAGIRDSGIARSELFVTGKLWNTERSYDKALVAFKQTLQNLNIGYLDLYLIHWPASPAVHEDWREINVDTWRAFERLYTEGLVRAIGVCNYRPHHLEELIDKARIMPMVNQIELHPGQNQSETITYCKRHDIIVEAWGPLGSGKMVKKAILNDYATKYGISVAQLCIRWCLQNGAIPLPKSKNLERIKENIDVFGFELTQEDMEAINAMPYMGGSGIDPDEITLFG